MNRTTTVKLIILALVSFSIYGYGEEARTFCNPLNIDCCFSISRGSYREAADPVVVTYRGDYYLFASHSEGYWWSKDFENWNFVTPTGLDIEKFAPAIMINGTYYLQYATPGTVCNAYAYACFVSKSHTGPFTFMPSSPVTAMPGGFVNGTGHGCLFQDLKGKWWKVDTVFVGVKHRLERRLPTGFRARNASAQTNCSASMLPAKTENFRRPRLPLTVTPSSFPARKFQLQLLKDTAGMTSKKV